MSLLPTPPPSLRTIPATSAASSTVALRPVVILPGLGNNTGDYKDMAMTLREGYGIPSVVARVSRVDWLRHAAALLSPGFWRGSLRPRPLIDWYCTVLAALSLFTATAEWQYLERVAEAVQEAKLHLEDGGSISLVGHSAGGWLARVYMEEFGMSRISLLLTLGSPHLPPPKGLPGVIDQTRGLLDYIEKNCAPAVYTPELKYICIAGRYIQGAPLFGNSNNPSYDPMLVGEELNKIKLPAKYSNDKSLSSAPSLHARFVGQSYKQVCGQADVWGDGVVPEVSAHLEGALNISLDGVYHSPVGSDGTIRPWFGSASVLKKWVHHLLT
ncbi:unnamed protein product [Musa hybrid cultivar]